MKSFAEADAVLETYSTGVWLALLTALAPLDGSTLPEASFGGYARQPLILGAIYTFVDATGRTVRRRQIDRDHTFGPVTAPSVAPIPYVAIMSAFSGGTLRRMLRLATPIPPPSAGVITFKAGAFAIHEG